MLSTTGRRLVMVMSVVLIACVMAASFGASAGAGVGLLPGSLSSAEFLGLSAELSEANGHFQSDNLVSNETHFQHVMPDLARIAKGLDRAGLLPSPDASS